MTIECQSREFKVHKVIICPPSPFLATAVKKDAFVVSTTRYVLIAIADGGLGSKDKHRAHGH